MSLSLSPDLCPILRPDLRPFESSGGIAAYQANSRNKSRGVTWTYLYAKEDQFNRFDYILASQGIYKEYVGSFVKSQNDWGIASDHRIVVAKFTARNR